MISNFDHYLEVKERYVTLNDKVGKAFVPDAEDFPEDVASQQRLVKELFNAMLEFDELIDEKRQLRAKKRKISETAGEEEGGTSRFEESTHVRRVREASNLEIELLCWELLVGIFHSPLNSHESSHFPFLGQRGTC